MSHADASLRPRLHPTTVARTVPALLAGLVVALQIAYPLVAQGPARDRLTVVIVLTFAAASLSHAAVWRGPRFAAALFATTALGGLAIEVVGVGTGLPFGEYRYLDSLGAQLLDVPLVVALAWMMMAYPAYVVAEVIGGSTLRRSVVGGWALAAWDLFLDPQMVQAGHWQWRTEGIAVAGIPVSNYAAWFVVATLMMVALRALTADRRDGADVHAGAGRVPVALYAWTWASSALAHAAFFGLPTSAALGGVGMGVVVVALVHTARARPSETPA